MASVVSAITGGVSGNTGGAGINYQASATPLIQSATQGQADQTFAQQQNALRQQQDFTNSVNAQNGLGNQSSVYNQLQGITNGTGPNPAQAQLAQATGANVANQSALMAGQRGSGANAGLIARQAAQQGAGTQQQAAGQAATMQANQSLNALNAQGSLATNQANQAANAVQGVNSAAQAGQNATLGAIGAQNQAAVGSVGSQNSANSAISSKVAGNQGDLFGGALQGLGAGVGGALGLADGGKVTAMADGGTATTQLQPQKGPKSSIGKYMAGQNQQGQQASNFGGDPKSSTYQGAQTMGANAVKAGQALYNYANTPSAPSPQAVAGGPMDTGMDAGADTGAAADAASSAAPAALDDLTMLAADGGVMQNVAQLAPLLLLAAKGGKVPVLLSPGEKKLSPEQAKAAAGGKIDPMKAGKTVPGKPKVGGAKNSYANDIIPDKLAPGSLVLPRSVTQSKNPHWAAHKFVMQHMAMAKGGKVQAKGK